MKQVDDVPFTQTSDPLQSDPALNAEFLASLYALNDAIANTGEQIEGNVCYWHETSPEDYRRAPPTSDLDHVKKRVNLWTMARRHQSMVEIGLNGGHSALICLTANPLLHFFSIDICNHAYTRVAVSYLRGKFGRRFHFWEGDSREVMPRLAIEQPHLRFDLMHVDGGHGAALAFTDISNCLRMKREPADLIFDDVNAPHLGEVLDQFVRLGHLVPLDTRAGLFETPLHDILRVS